MDFPIIHKAGKQQQVTFPIKPKRNGFMKQDKFKRRKTTFQAAMKLMVTIGQIFSLNPVSGIWDSDPTKLRFTYFSGRCVYTIFTISSQIVFLNIFIIMRYLKTWDTSVGLSTAIVFYSSTTMITVLFLRVASKWPKLCQYIARTEAADPLYDITLIKKCNLSCICILLLAGLEHGLAEFAGFVMSADCEPEKIYYKFISTSFPWIEAIVSYSHALGIITQCVPSSFWRTVREDYNRVTNLVRRVDDVIGSIIFISFANNLFFICLQLLHALAEGIKATQFCSKGPNNRFFHGYEYSVYYTYSLVFLILRSMAVSLIASRVHTASREPAYTLYEVPSTEYCIEVQRFIEQIHGETVALTGLQFFKVKRGIVLTIAGTIVTYELVLMQFTGVTPTVGTLIDNE